MFHINPILIKSIKLSLLILGFNFLISCASQQPKPSQGSTESKIFALEKPTPADDIDKVFGVKIDESDEVKKEPLLLKKQAEVVVVDEVVDEDESVDVADKSVDEDEPVDEPVDDDLINLVDEEQYNSLETDALLNQAEALFENHEFEKALFLFKLAVKRSDAQFVRTYAGLYQTYLKLEVQAAAENAFSKLLEARIMENKKLNFKFLFSVNSSEFINDVELKNEYLFWLRQIARYFDENSLCSLIIGHSSVTEDANNQELSLERAKKIQELMADNFPIIMQSSKIIGESASENMIGTDSNDVMDTLDRRVEMIVVECSQ
ncbi:MAG: hypothetical protein KAI83_07710 [Thiomargarita sp.]|nr:hypothetical protein [Thiomargarita sp.]